MKQIIFYFIPLLFFSYSAKSQTHNQTETSLNVKASKEFLASLSNYENGSAFSIVLFNLSTNSKFNKISVTSSNSVSKIIIDSLLNANPDCFKFSDKKIGNFAIPIIQVMVNDEKEGINWKNNSSWEMAKFANHLNLPEQTILLNPIFIMGTKTINN